MPHTVFFAAATRAAKSPLKLRNISLGFLRARVHSLSAVRATDNSAAPTATSAVVAGSAVAVAAGCPAASNASAFFGTTVAALACQQNKHFQQQHQQLLHRFFSVVRRCRFSYVCRDDAATFCCAYSTHDVDEPLFSWCGYAVKASANVEALVAARRMYALAHSWFICCFRPMLLHQVRSNSTSTPHSLLTQVTLPSLFSSSQPLQSPKSQYSGFLTRAPAVASAGAHRLDATNTSTAVALPPSATFSLLRRRIERSAHLTRQARTQQHFSTGGITTNRLTHIIALSPVSHAFSLSRSSGDTHYAVVTTAPQRYPSITQCCSQARGSSQTNPTYDSTAVGVSPLSNAAPDTPAVSFSGAVSSPSFSFAGACVKSFPFKLSVYVTFSGVVRPMLLSLKVSPVAVKAPYEAASLASFSTGSSVSFPPNTCKELHATAAARVMPAADVYKSALSLLKTEGPVGSNNSSSSSRNLYSEGKSSGKQPLIAYSQCFSKLLFDFLMGLCLTVSLSGSKPLPSFLPPILSATQQLLFPTAASLLHSNTRNSSIHLERASNEAATVVSTPDNYSQVQWLQHLRTLEAPAAAAVLLFIAVMRCRHSSTGRKTVTPAQATASSTTREKKASPAAEVIAANEGVGELKLPRLLLLDILAELGAALSLRETQLTPQHLVLLRVALELLQGEESTSDRRNQSSSNSSGVNSISKRERDICLLQHLRQHCGPLGAVAADFYQLLPLHPHVYAEQLVEESVTAAVSESDDEDHDSVDKEDDDSAAATGEFPGVTYEGTNIFEKSEGLVMDTAGIPPEADKAPKQQRNGSASPPSASSSRSTDSSAVNMRQRDVDMSKEVSTALRRLEKSHDILPTYIGPFLFTLRNSASRDLYVCLKQKDFFVNEPDRLLPKEEWRYRIAELHGWKVTLVAVEREWLKLPSAAAKLQYVEMALLKQKPIF